MVHAVFVYGTLKRGQSRETVWPCRPMQVVPAWTFGELHDLGPYPALGQGNDRVLGELWIFGPQDMPQTLEALDVVEGFHGRDNDLYIREVVRCWTLTGAAFDAHIYRFRDVERWMAAKRVRPDEEGWASWG